MLDLLTPENTGRPFRMGMTDVLAVLKDNMSPSFLWRTLG